jgi:hypothetical protein
VNLPGHHHWQGPRSTGPAVKDGTQLGWSHLSSALSHLSILSQRYDLFLVSYSDGQEMLEAVQYDQPIGAQVENGSAVVVARRDI